MNASVNKRIKQYRKVFVPSHYTPFGIQSPKQQLERQWSTITAKKRFLDDRTIAKHLAGLVWVAPQLKTFTNTIVIDVDAGPKLDKRMAEVCAAFPDSSPLAFSTPRDGRHLHFVLSKPAFSESARRFAHDRLTAADVPIVAGQVEVFPAGNKIIRAPLGRDCYLLDEDDVPVSSDREANLWTLDQILINEQYDTLTLPVEYDKQPPQFAKKKRSHDRRPFMRNNGGEFMQEVDKLLSVGLTAAGQRNAALLKLNWYMHVIWSLDSTAVEQNLIAWIDRNHNGRSVDYNANSGRVHSGIKQIVKAFDHTKVGTGSNSAPGRPMVDSDAFSGPQQGIEAHLDELALDGRTRRFYGRLLEFANRRGIRRTLNGQIEIEIPSRTLKKFDRKYGEILPELLASGIVSKSRNYSVQKGRANTFICFPAKATAPQCVTEKRGGAFHISS
jgi:hypothetical protein